MNRLILGGGGFIGGHLAKHFKDTVNDVTIVDLKHHTYYRDSEISDEYIIADLRDCRVVSKIFAKEYDEVYQFACDVGGAGYINNGNADMIYNSALINLNIASEARKHKIKKLFFSSSSCAYPFADGDYGHEKLFSEILYLAFQRNYDLDIKIGRFQNVYGTHDIIFNSRERFITAICRKIASEKDTVEVWGEGTQKRSFIYVDDCIREIINLMESKISEPINIGSEKCISINDITKLIIDISGKDLKIKNIYGERFYLKYGYQCPVGVTTKYPMGIPKDISMEGLIKTYQWVNKLVNES